MTPVRADGVHRALDPLESEALARAQAPQVEVEDGLEVGQHRRLGPRTRRARRDGDDPGPALGRRAAPDLRASSGRTPDAAAYRLIAGPSAAGSRLSRNASLPQGPACSIRRYAATVDAVPARSSPRARLAAAQRNGRRAHRDDLEQALADEPAAQDQAATAASSIVEVAGGQLTAHAQVLQGGAQPGRHLQDAVAEQHPHPVGGRARHQDARPPGPPAQPVCRRSRSRTSSTSRRPPRCRGRPGREEPLGLGVDHAGRVHGRGRRPRARRAGRPAASPAGSGRRGSRRAGGRREPRRPAASTVRRSRPRQVSWLMPSVTCRDAPSCARAACGVPVGRYIDRPGSSSTSSRTARGCLVVHLPELGAVGLEDEDVVAVAVHREALRAGRGQVGVGLAGVPELDLEVGDQPRQRRPVAVQALEHDRRPAVEEGGDLARVDQSGERSAGQARRARVRRLGQHAAVLGDPDRRRPDRRLGEQVVDVVEREQPDEQVGVGAVQVHAGRPDLRQEGLGVAAQQVESAHLRAAFVGRQASVPSASPPSVPSASPPSVASSPRRRRRCRPRRRRRCRPRRRRARDRRRPRRW